MILHECSFFFLNFNQINMKTFIDLERFWICSCAAKRASFSSVILARSLSFTLSIIHNWECICCFSCSRLWIFCWRAKITSSACSMQVPVLQMSILISILDWFLVCETQLVSLACNWTLCNSSKDSEVSILMQKQSRSLVQYAKWEQYENKVN